MAEEYVNFTVVNAVSKDITLDEVEQATLKDNVLQQDHSTTCFNKIIIQRVSTRSFYNVRYELTVSPKLLCEVLVLSLPQHCKNVQSL